MCLEDGHTTPATICNHIDKASKGKTVWRKPELAPATAVA
jgi:hypothetical protein